jgi:hypothetical protein
VFDRKTYFDSVRPSLFSGSLSQQQVDGQNDILGVWDALPKRFPTLKLDRRWLAYMLATTYHETSKEMWPIEEYSKGSGQPYGKKDPETGQTYYGRGYVQLTWRDNYAHATDALNLAGTNDDMEWHAERALDPVIAAKIMYLGMYQGWFRKSQDGRPQTLTRYFNETTDDAYEAREIINGDKSKVPTWSNGVSIGNLIKGYHGKFLTALEASWNDDPGPGPWPENEPVTIHITSNGNDVKIFIDGKEV